MARKQPQMTNQTLKVILAIMQADSKELSGAEIGRLTKLLSGTLYPILMRCEAAGWLESRWETDEPQTLGRPRRRFYTVTGLGATRARAATQEMDAIIGRPAWA